MTINNYQALKAALNNPALLVTDLSEYEDYFSDATIYKAQPEAILLAESDSDILSAVEFCNNNNIGYLIRGAGTGLSGGCVPSKQQLIISMERMTKIYINAENKIAIVQSGAITKTLMDDAGQHNLTYLPDPASYDESTLGGNVAENAGGLRCLKYGVTRDYVLGLKIITTDGKLLETGYYTDNKGFNLTDLFIASEGTLGIITEIALRLSPIPSAVNTILATFDKSKDAAQTVSDIRQSGIIPTVMEFLDGDAAECSNEYEKSDGLENVGAILLMEADSDDSKIISVVCNKNNTRSLVLENNPEKVEQLWKVRRNLSNAIKAAGKIRINEDIAVPISKFPDIVDYVAQMNSSSNLRINSFGHAGDGNLHVNFLSPSGSEDDRVEIEKLVVDLMNKTISLGGTLTGEHGIGLAKRKYLPLEFDSPTIQFMKYFKSIFDSENLLNSDKIFT